MAATAALSARKRTVEEIIGSAAMKKVAASTQQVHATPAVEQKMQVSVPTANAFYKVMFNPTLDPEQKKVEVTKLATFTGSKEESRALLKQYAEFEEYLQTVRKEMSVEIIKLQDTDAFSVLQDTMNSLNSALLMFEEQIKPLTDITDAIYTLRTNDATLDVFREIQDDKQKEEEVKKTASERETNFKLINDKVTSLLSQNAVLAEDKGFFGLGGVKREARERIAQNNIDLSNSQAELDRLENELVDVTAQEIKAPGQFEAEKAQLRNLLDLTKEQHKENQKALVQTALNFVNDATGKIGVARTHLEAMTKRTENLLDNNTKMTGIYAVLTEGLEDAQKQNYSERDKLLVVPEGERSIAKMQREDLKVVMDDHVRLVDNAVRTTTAANADLTTQTIRVKNMKDANENVVEQTRVLHTQGVAGIADRLSTTLQAVASAALGESSAAAKDTLRHMAKMTDQISQRESIRVAMGIKEVNKDLLEALDSLGTYGEVQRAANDITRAGISEVRNSLDQMKKISEETRRDLQDSYSAVADSHLHKPPISEPESAKSEASNFNPFNQ